MIYLQPSLLKKRTNLLLVFLLAMLPGLIAATTTEPPKKKPVKVEGTGRTTMHVLNIIIDNREDEPITVTTGPFLVPSTGKYQGYILPEADSVTVAPNSTRTVAVNGYCTDIHRPAVPAGKKVVDYEEWIPKPEAATAVWGYTASHPGLEHKSGVPIGGTLSQIVVTYPGTDDYFPYTIDINRYPEASAPALFDAMDRIQAAYDSLLAEDLITTPFSPDREKERQAIIQQTFWLYTAALTGDEYKVAEFEENLIDDFEEKSGQDYQDIPTSAQEELKAGVDQFWTTFTAVGSEAKVFKEVAPNKQARNGGELQRLRDAVRDEDGDIDEEALEDLVEHLELELLDEVLDDFADLGLGSAIGAAITLADMPSEVCDLIKSLRDAIRAVNSAERRAAASEYIRAWKNIAGLPSISSISAGTNELVEAIDNMNRQERLRAGNALHRTYLRICR